MPAVAVVDLLKEARQDPRAKTPHLMEKCMSVRWISLWCLCMILQARAESLAVLDQFLLFRVFVRFLHWLQSCVPFTFWFCFWSAWSARCHCLNFGCCRVSCCNEFSQLLQCFGCVFNFWECRGVWRSAGRRGKGAAKPPPQPQAKAVAKPKAKAKAQSLQGEVAA